MDYKVKETLDLLLKNGPMNLQKDLSDWKTEEIDGKTTLFYKGKNYIPKDQELRWDIVKMSMITKLPDILENWKLTTLCNNIIGGQDYEHL